jgi:prophage antirepressor-like protein
MMQLSTFVYERSALRAVSREGEPWFVAKDGCNILALENVGQAISSLDGDEKAILNHGELVELGIINRDDLDITRLALVSESGLYSLIFKSMKPEAKAFKRWITHEVLPSIRKTGGYQAQAFRVPNTLHEALSLAAGLEKERMALACKVSEQADDLAVLEPKAAFADRVGAAHGSHTIAAAAKILGTGQNRLFAWLRMHGYLIQGTCTPYQCHMDSGLFLVRERVFTDEFGHDHIKAKTYITGKGMLAIQRRLDAENSCPLLKPQHLGGGE